MKNKYIIVLLILTLILMCGCTNNSDEIEVITEDENKIEISNDENSFSLENTIWSNSENGSEYHFYSKSNKTNFKEKTADELLYEGYYTLTTNEKEVKQFREFFEGSKNSLKKHFKENKEEMDNTIEFGLAINTNEHESIIHEYYGLYTENKILIAEVGSDDTVFVLNKIE